MKKQKLLLTAFASLTWMATTIAQTPFCPTDTFTPMPNMSNFSNTAVLIGDTMYTIGNNNTTSRPNPVTEYLCRYIIATGVVDTISNPPFNDVGNFSLTSFDGNLYVFGGYDDATGSFENLAYMYTLSTNTWSSLQVLPAAMECSSVTLNNYIYITGRGATNTPQYFFRYDPVNNSYESLATPDVNRSEGKLIVYNNSIYCAGGTNYANTFDNYDIYDSASNSWASLSPMPFPLTLVAATVWGSYLYVFSGDTAYGEPPSLLNYLAYDFTSGNWTVSSKLTNTPINDGAAVTFQDTIYIANQYSLAGEVCGQHNVKYFCAASCLNVAASITPQPNSSFCQGDSTVLQASTGSSYIWGNNATTQSITVTQAGNYTVTVTNSNGCTASASQNVTVNSNPTVSITANGPTNFCQGGNVTLTASPNNSYAWNNNENSQDVIVNQTGNYIVTVTNGNNCTAIASQNVTVNPNPTVSITANGPTIFCQGGSVTLTATSNNSYAWSNNGNSQNVTVNQTGNYIVTVTNGNNCTASASQSVTVNPLPSVSFSLPGFINNQVTSYALNGSPSGGSYSGIGGITGNTLNPSQAGLGAKLVTYTYTNINNCTNSTTASAIFYDTTGIVCTSYDTVTTYVYDTLITNINDTTLTHLYDTVTTHLFDTTTTHVFDTVTIHVNDTLTTSISTTDTLIINVDLTGISPPNNTNLITVYPNPTHNYLEINCSNYTTMTGYSIKITNILGQAVFNQPITQQLFNINLSTFGGDGIYILYVIDPQQNIKSTKEIILQ